MKYFLKIGHKTAIKNKLQKDVNEYMDGIDRSLILDIERFKIGFLAEIDRLNRLHPRCKPIKIDIYASNNGDLSVYGIHFLGHSIHIYKISNTI